ncbi:MAG: ATP-dependent Clp protease ATP-binding subunit [Candidatus Moranbacteria bacterium]|jgi:ATP-dependent Clp protease ATP-binding subunit ClpA|nr:ATP-dependent Clp protease ATP-binding subunit [Candidatus Moranbacteria bacterium]
MNLFLFVRWYYREGVQNCFTNVWNLLRLVLFRFNTLELTKTLLSPWKRDIEYRSWRGFHPIKEFSRLFENALSRFLGLCVRLPVVIFGSVFFVVASVIVMGFYILFLIAPVLPISGGLVYWLSGGSFIYTQWIYLASAIGVSLAGISFLFRAPEMIPLQEMDFSELQKMPWFERVLSRLEMDMDDIPKDALENKPAFLTLLKMRNTSEEMLAYAIDIEQKSFVQKERAWRFWLPENFSKRIPMGKDWRFGYTPRLDRYSLDLSSVDRATEYDKMDLVGRQAEFRVAAVILERPQQNNVFLVGEPGVGKKMFIHYLAKKIRSRSFSHGSPLNSLRVLLFNLGEAVNESIARGENPEVEIRGFFQEATKAGNILLVIEDVDLFLGMDPQQPNIAHLLEEFLEMPTFRFIGIAVAARYHALAKKDEQILKYFETIYLRQPSIIENEEILLQFFAVSERKQVVLTIKAMRILIASARRYNWEMPYPERVLDLAQQVMIYFRNQPRRFLNEQVVNEYVSMKTGAQIGEITQSEQQKLLNLETELHARVVGQDEAINQVSQVLRRARAGFHDAKKPLGSFLFLGPTGVGKTETVKALAESIFNDEEKMFRLDMSEFQTANSVDRLLGSQEDGSSGILTKAMKERPYCIFLLDEVEKAYPKILDIFLQVLDEGSITDAFGEKISFRNAVIIATSNAGSILIKDLSQRGMPLNVLRRQVIDGIVRDGTFRIEFLNRFDNLIFFEALSITQLIRIADLKLRKFVEQVKQQKNITLIIEPGVAERIVELGYEPDFGARSVNRFITDHVEDIIVRKIIVGGSEQSGGVLTIAPRDIMGIQVG